VLGRSAAVAVNTRGPHVFKELKVFLPEGLRLLGSYNVYTGEYGIIHLLQLTEQAVHVDKENTAVRTSNLEFVVPVQFSSYEQLYTTTMWDRYLQSTRILEC
jgi:hypothetical protein